jgi:hypothetical protein
VACGHQHARHRTLLLQKIPHRLHGGRLAALSLYEEIENLAFVIHRTPKQEPLAGNDHGNLIEMPARGWTRASACKFLREQRPKL